MEYITAKSKKKAHENGEGVLLVHKREESPHHGPYIKHDTKDQSNRSEQLLVASKDARSTDKTRSDLSTRVQCVA